MLGKSNSNHLVLVMFLKRNILSYKVPMIEFQHIATLYCPSKIPIGFMVYEGFITQFSYSTIRDFMLIEPQCS